MQKICKQIDIDTIIYIWWDRPEQTVQMLHFLDPSTGIKMDFSNFRTNMVRSYDDDDLVFYIPFNIILVISRWWKGDNERLCAMKHYTAMSSITPPAGSNWDLLILIQVH